MLSLIRAMKLNEITDLAGWSALHKATCPYGGRFEFDHSPTEINTGKAKYRGIKITVVCKCGAKKELGIA